MAGSAKAPGCGEYNRKNGLARQIYTIRRGGPLPNYHILGWKALPGRSKRSPLFATLIPGRVSGRPQLGSQEIKNRRHREHNSIYFKFPCSCVPENPDDGDNRECGHDFHSRKVEGLCAVGANVALHQKPAGGAAEQIH